MTYSAPSYIPARALEAMPITHKWDDWDPYPLIAKNNPETENWLAQAGNYAKFVFAIGCAEWVVARFDRELNDIRSWQYIDACWAYEMSSDFTLPAELDDSQWLGPILGPVCLALTTVINTRYGFDEDNAQIDVAFAEQVALHVMPDNRLFQQWRDIVLCRLVDLCPVDSGLPSGIRLPRHVLNPDVIIEANALPSLLKASLEGLDLLTNPFVRKARVGWVERSDTHRQ
jgi:hypothetical protein